MFFFTPLTDVSLVGPLTISGNAAEVFGGALCVFGGRLNISGTVCATNNTVTASGVGGSFAAVDGSSLNVETGAVVNVGENSPDAKPTLLLQRGASGSMTCGSGSSSWVDGEYVIQGPLCACTAAFEAGTSTTCDSCGSRGWNPAKCACAVSRACVGGAEHRCKHAICNAR
jgi:hypothetical protein